MVLFRYNLLMLVVFCLSSLNKLCLAGDPTVSYELHLKYKTLSPLGLPQQVVSQSPSYLFWNAMDEGLLLSWAGVQLRHNSWQDGVPGTNCPILPGRNFTYRFQVKDQIGSYYYFPSTHFQRASGGSGIPKRSVLAEIPTPYSTPRKNVNAQAHKKHKKELLRHVLGLFVGEIVGCLFGYFALPLLFKRFKRTPAANRGRKNSSISIFSSLFRSKKELEFLLNEEALLSLEVIGRGGCGTVFKKELPGGNGKFIAIKKIVEPEEDTRSPSDKMRQIKAEINTIGQIRHINLLPLLAHVSIPNCHYLVYELMDYGSLHDILKKVSGGIAELHWLLRYKIAVGVAAGLEYLHFNQNPRILHRDLKPANVLLDDDMEPRIIDFGLAKAMPDAYTHVSTSHVAGTFGYMAPEYVLTSMFTEKCDIYSYGVLLAVLVVGHFPSDEFFRMQEVSLIGWMRSLLISEHPTQAIHPTLLGNGYDEQMLLVLKIACHCTADDANKRPNSREVLAMLAQIRH